MTTLLNGFSIITSFSWWALPCPWCVASPLGTMLRLAGWSGSSWRSWISSLAWFLIAGHSKRLWKEGNHKCSWRWFVTLCHESFSHTVTKTQRKSFFSLLPVSAPAWQFSFTAKTQCYFCACLSFAQQTKKSSFLPSRLCVQGFLCQTHSLW